MVKRKAQGIVVKREAPAAKPPQAPPQAADREAEEEEAPPAQAPNQRKKKRRRQAAEAAAPTTAPPSAPALPPVACSTAGPGAAAGAPSPLAAGGERLTPTAVLEWLLWPISPGAFFSEHWEKKPLHVRRGRPDHYGQLFSKADLDRALREQPAEFQYGDRINLARFDGEAGRKISLNKGDRGTPVVASDVHAAWAEGASIQAMHPQQYHEPVWRLLVSLERGFSSLFGANSYFTPAGCQGLAPHFDDVEVFMLQLEGRKRWRLHAPPEGEEYPLPREYSRDFGKGEVGELLLDCVLEPGDLLYLPRGTVHSGVTEGKPGGEGGASFSHHLTVSTYQKTAWCNLLERALLGALGKAASEDAAFRAGLPVGFLGYMGSWHDREDDAIPEAMDARAAFLRQLKRLAGQLQDFIDPDEVCDELGVDFMSQRLPPAAARAGTAPGQGAPTTEVEKETAVAPSDRVRWLDPSAVRAMISTDPETSEATVMLFHSFANSRGQHMCKAVEAEEEVGCLRYEAATFLPAIHALYGAGTDFIPCSSLPLAHESDKVALCENLLEAGLLEREAAV